MKIQPLEKNIKSLIGDQTSYFSVPDYQRPYRWTREHINDFWSDICTAYDNHEENYFLGSLILIRKPDGNEFELVDGQQRLTTITIFLAVLRDYFAENNKNDLANKIQNEFICKEGKYRLQVSEGRLDFENYVSSGLHSLGNKKPIALNPHVISTVACLRDNIRSKEEELQRSDKQALDYLEALYEFFMDKTLVVNIIAEDLSSAYTIFETINQRGEGLETDELLKNYLLKRLHEEVSRHNRLNKDSQKNFEAEKQALLEGYRYIKGLLGEEISMQELLRFHWTAVFGIKPKTNLYKEIISYIKSKNAPSNEFIRDWKDTADCFVSLSEGDWFRSLNFETRNNLKLLWNVNHREWLPVLIAARRQDYDKESFQELVGIVERMYALFWIAGHFSSKIKNPTLSLIREYINKQMPVSEIGDYVETIMQKSRVLSHFIESIEGDCYGSSWCAYALSKYEYTLTDNSMNKDIDPSTTQIEHVLPQSMTSQEWKRNFTDDDHERLVDTIGNLTLLIGGVKEKNKSKNQTASNKSFEEKKKIYLGETLGDGVSAFQMTQDLKGYGDWTVANIEARSRRIRESLCKVWGVTEASLENENKIDTGENNLITSGELKVLSELAALLPIVPDVEILEVPQSLSEDDNIVRSRRAYIEGSYVNLISDDLPLCCGIWRRVFGDRPAMTYLFIQWDDSITESLKSLMDDYDSGSALVGWEYDVESDAFLCKFTDDPVEMEIKLKEAYSLATKYNKLLSELDFGTGRSRTKKRKGSYPIPELRERLTETLERETPLTPRLKVFFRILLSERRKFKREEIKELLREAGVGSNKGGAGTYLSNISQFITKSDNDHLRQIIDYRSEDFAGAHKDDYYLRDEYRDLVSGLL